MSHGWTVYRWLRSKLCIPAALGVHGVWVDADTEAL